MQALYLDEKENSEVLQFGVGHVVDQDGHNGQNIDVDVWSQVLCFDFWGLFDEATLHHNRTVEPDNDLDEENDSWNESPVVLEGMPTEIRFLIDGLITFLTEEEAEGDLYQVVEDHQCHQHIEWEYFFRW